MRTRACIELQQCGPVSSIIQTPSSHGIYLGTGFFTMNYNVVTEDATVDTLDAARDAASVGGNPMAGRFRFCHILHLLI